MSLSDYITETDISLFTVAFQRKLDLHQKYLFSPGIEKRRESKSFKSQSCHFLPEILKRKYPDLSPFHDYEEEVLKKDFNYCIEAVVEESVVRLLSMNCNRFESGSSGVQSINSLEKFLCFKDYLHLFPHPLKEQIEQIDPIRRLSWIVSLLIDFHCGHECKAFMSCAIKLCLKSLQFSLYSYMNMIQVVNSKLQMYLKMIQKNQCDVQLLDLALKVFFVDPGMKFHFFRKTRCLEFILKNIQSVDSRFQVMLNHDDELGKLKIFDLCFDCENFVTLVDFGAQSFYSKQHWDIMKHIIFDQEWFLFADEHKFFSTGEYNLPYDRPIDLRVNQIGALLDKGRSNDSFRPRMEFLLKLQWSAIPDSFLTEEEFISCGKSNGWNIDVFEEKLAEAWLWYKEIVLEGRDVAKSPRSLMHLSRCAIRNILATNSQLPDGVETLILPKRILNYLLLKDCGNNPFEEDDSVGNLIWLYSK